jgi:hypothetical protein
MRLKLQVKNIINQEQRFTQEVKETGEKYIVKYYKKGTSVDLGFTLNF